MEQRAFYEMMIRRHKEAIVKDRAMLENFKKWRKAAKARGDNASIERLENDRKWYYKQIRWEEKHIANYEYMIRRYC